MPLSKVVINVGQGGLGRRPLNKDKISGLLFFDDTLPSGFLTTDRVKKVFSLAQAESLGIAQASAAHDVHWYQISEYFRVNPEGELWIGYFAVPVSTYSFAEITTMVNIAQGEIRQLGVYAEALTFAAAQVTTIQSIVNLADADGKPLSVLYAANMAAITAITGWAGVTDLRTLTARKVTVVIAESGSGAGQALAAAKAFSITALGAALGALSLSSVEQSIGNPQNFNISNGIEMEIPALANGDLVSAVGDATLGSLKDKGYLVARKYVPKIQGTYFERCPTSISATNDFAWIETNRTIDKAIRLVDAALTPLLQGTIILNADGSLKAESVGYFVDVAQRPLTQMEADEEASATQVIIDPNQDILGTSNLQVTIKIVPVGIAETITVNIGLTTAL